MVTNAILHEFNASGRRMRSKFDDATDWTNFVYDEVTGNLIAEYALVSGTYTLSATYTWGAGLLKQQRGATKRFYHFDGSGNSSALTDASQSVTDTYSYNAFGVVISSSGSSVNPFRWLGQVGAYDDGSRGSAFGLVKGSKRYYRSPLEQIISGPPAPLVSPGIRPKPWPESLWDKLGIPPPPPGSGSLGQGGSSGSGSGLAGAEATADSQFVLGHEGDIGTWLPYDPPNPGLWTLFGPFSSLFVAFLSFGYGRYCGWDRRGPGGPIGSATGPIDAIDECCAIHDECLTAWAAVQPGRIHTCQRLLALCAASRSCAGSPDPNCEAARIWLMAFGGLIPPPSLTL